MRRFTLGAIGAGLIGIVAVGLVAVGTPDRRHVAVPAAPAPTAMTSVSANGFALTSVAVAMPDDASRFPAAAHVDVVTANCASCHSPSMVLTQPPLTHEQWQATITKMREVYRAPIADADVPAILAYLDALSARTDTKSRPDGTLRP